MGVRYCSRFVLLLLSAIAPPINAEAQTPDTATIAGTVSDLSHAVVRPLDVDAPTPFIRTLPGQTRSAQAANCTRPYWVARYAQHGRFAQPRMRGLRRIA